MGVVSEAIESSTGQQIIVEDFSPFFEGAVAGDDERSTFVAFADDVVEVLSGLGVKG
jgi:hypothetical protein